MANVPEFKCSLLVKYIFYYLYLQDSFMKEGVAKAAEVVWCLIWEIRLPLDSRVLRARKLSVFLNIAKKK